MSLLAPIAGQSHAPEGDVKRASRELEVLMLKQLLASSGAFKGSGAAGSSFAADVFADTLADAVAKAGGLGLGKAVEAQLGAAAGLPEVELTSGFGPRLDPFTGALSSHQGIDLLAAKGTPILAADDGVVVRAGERGGYGLCVEVEHPGGLRTLYAHASKLDVAQGEAVHKGQPLGQVGSTGRATGDHLHFEVRQGGRAVDPLSVLKIYRGRADE